MPSIPSSGLWKPTHLQALYYGDKAVYNNILSALPSKTSKAYIVTTSSLKDSSALHSLQERLGSQYAGTFSSIRAHAPIKDLDAATSAIKDSSVDTIISLGGGSPIDSSKAIVHRMHEQTGQWLLHVSIPTTLSAAEVTWFAGVTNEDGVKTSVRDPHLAPQVIIYDAGFIVGLTPQKLWLSTGMRALDHAVEIWYHSDTPLSPTRALAFSAVKDLFEFLRASKKNPDDKEIVTRLQLAAFNSLWPFGLAMTGGIGLSHSLGYALGSPYGIPHGITSCLTLGKVVKLCANQEEKAAWLAQLLPAVGKGQPTGDNRADTVQVGDAIEELVDVLGLKTDLNAYNVEKSELDTIVARATGGDKGQLAEKVNGLVQTLWKDGSEM